MAEVVIATAAVVGALTAGGSAWRQSVSASHQASRTKSAQREQDKQMEEQRAKALEERKAQIDRQRMAMSGRGQGTRGFSTTGVRAVLGDENGTLG